MSKIEIEGSDEYLTTADVAQKTRTSQSYWEKLRVVGGGPRFSKPARFVRYRWQDVAEFMDGKTSRSTSEDIQSDHADSEPGEPGQLQECLQEDDVRDGSRGDHELEDKLDDKKKELVSDFEADDEA